MVFEGKIPVMDLASGCLIFLCLLNPFMLSLADSKCPKSFICGDLGPLEFPLSNYTEPECGLFSVNCDVSPPKIQLWPGGVSYEVRQRMSTNRYRVLDIKLVHQLTGDKRSCDFVGNLPLPNSPVISFSISPNLTMYSCSKFRDRDDTEKIQEYFQGYRNYTDCELFTLYYKDRADRSPSRERSIPEGCSVVQMPWRTDNQYGGDLFQLLSAEFELEWNVPDYCRSCHNSGNKCLVTRDNKFHCQGKNRKTVILASVAGASMTVVTSTSILWFLLIRKKRTLLKLPRVRKAKPDCNEKDIELFLRKHGNLAPTRYKYSDLKKVTNSFCENLGRGGYGSVYKGKLPDGRLVAVKLLNESQGNGEEFMNEVASISRTSHINIVTLLGFCFEGSSKRALIYDFMPNGSLEKFIQTASSSGAPLGGLGWQKLLEIAVGIARGLEYLHRGCNMRIVHFDIKPHNILLDRDLHPKISDFGLAKLCPNRSSIVSMLVARGTIGYIAPEVFCRNFGEVSHKSDVYSYGMMVLEMAGGRRNINPRDVDHSSEMYFPHYIYKQLEIMDAENLDGIMDTEDESQIAKRKLIIVGLWCIQTDPKGRPSMSKVVEMLEGKLEFLQVPPKPYLSSPPRSPPKFSISESM